MGGRRGDAIAAIGITVKSGWAGAVLLSGSVLSPRVLDSRRIQLSDPAIPEARQPYHDGFGTARRRGRERSRLIASVKRFGRHAVVDVVRQFGKQGSCLRGAGIVVGSLTDPDEITNDHIRIHALEGRLFRGVVEEGVARTNLPHSVWRDRDLQALGSAVLGQSALRIRRRLTELGTSVTGPWRAEQKSAALAAWLVLARHAQAEQRRGAGG
jgi:hypothetical protein